MLTTAEKLLLVKIFQVVISTRVGALPDDYKLEVPNINIRFWQAPLRESVYQSIARHRVYRGENLDERQEYDRTLWGKIRIARFMKRLDVGEASEGLRTGVLVHGKRGDFEFRQTDHSIYDCVGRKCRSDNVLLAVWRVQQMNEPYTLYISVKVPNYLYHFEPTEDIYLYTVEKGLKRLRYQQYSSKRLTGKLIYDPYPFVSSRFTTYSTASYPTATPTTALEVTATNSITEATETVDTYSAEHDFSQPNLGSDTSNSPIKVNDDFTLQYYQKPELTTNAPLSTELEQTNLADNMKGSGIRRTFDTFLDTNPYWQLDLLSPPSQYRNFSDERKKVYENNYDTFRDSIFTVNQPKEILITPKPFKPSQQIFTYSEPDPLFSNVENEKPQYTTERPVVILNPTEAQKDVQKDYVNPLPEVLSEVKDVHISPAKIELELPKLKSPEILSKKPQRKVTTRRGSSNFKTMSQLRKRTRVRSNKYKQDKILSVRKLEDQKSPEPTISDRLDLKDQYLSPTTYHPKLNFLIPSESRQFYTHLLPAKEETALERDELQPYNVEKATKNSLKPKIGKIRKRQEDGGYFANEQSEYSEGATDHPYEYQTTVGEYADYEKWDESFHSSSPSTDFQAENTDYFNETQELQEFYSTGGYEGSEYATFGDYTEAATDHPWTEQVMTELPLEGRANRRLESDQETKIKANSTDNNSDRLSGNGTEPKTEAFDEDSTEKFTNFTEDKIVTNGTLDEEIEQFSPVTQKMVTAAKSDETKMEKEEGEKERKEDVLENREKFLGVGKNSRVSIIESRLTKSVTEKRQNGTMEVRKRNAPIYRKKILIKKLQDLKSDKDRNSK
ncbi:unnamed protein product [Bemisia tabaci]|uniref:Uncharacterized protein n=1 Tax=Bemisia tabaci TaxID=7038 RepID=A0A9P0AFP6_BEMTA|nr:unnamed protein product [Bemisia tabaci]